MPYKWTHAPNKTPQSELRLWPHNSLPPKGFAAFILGTYLMTTIPLYGLIGTAVFWGLLPFSLAALAGIWVALSRNARDRQITETLTITAEDMSLVRNNPDGRQQRWDCNPYWARVSLHEKGGPVPFYITLSGAGREVEIGAFLSEDERKTLFADLQDELARVGRA